MEIKICDETISKLRKLMDHGNINTEEEKQVIETKVNDILDDFLNNLLAFFQ